MPTCAACGAEVPLGAQFCPACGAALSPGAGTGGARPSGASGVAGPSWAARLRGLSLGVQVAGAALVVVFIGLLLPWLSANALNMLSLSEDGFNGWGWLSLVALLGGVAVVVSGALRPSGAAPGGALPLGEALAGRLLMVSGGVGLLGVVLFWATAPSSSLGVQIGIGSGLVVSLLGFLAVIGAGALASFPELTSSLRARLRGPGPP